MGRARRLVRALAPAEALSGETPAGTAAPAGAVGRQPALNTFGATATPARSLAASVVRRGAVQRDCVAVLVAKLDELEALAGAAT